LQAQTSRSRTANEEENHQKLFQEIQRLYDERVPSETSSEKRQKYAQLCVLPSSVWSYVYADQLYSKKSSTEARLKAKKMQGSKKASRRSGGSE
jgi:peptidyl-tRNA hydrolase ICT1